MSNTISPATSLKPAWQAAPGAYTLPSGEVQVWRAPLDVDREALGRLRATLSAEEQARAERFHAPLGRDRFAAGRGILRSLLARYLGVAAGDLSFCTNAHGKPALDPGSGPVDLRFNLSHSHGLALFALPCPAKWALTWSLSGLP